MNKVMELIMTAGPDHVSQRTLYDKLSKNFEGLARMAGDVNPALDALSPRDHTVGYTFLVAAKSSKIVLNEQTWVAYCNQTALLLTQANPVYVPLVAKESKIFVRQCLYPAPAIAVRPLYTACSLLQGGRNDRITPCHPLYLKVCLMAKLYNVAERALGPELVDIDCNVQEAMEYFYYGGMVFTGLKKWAEAAHYYEICLSTPASTLSAIALAAFKCYTFVSLLSTGKPSELTKSKHVASVVLRGIKQLAMPYIEFTNAFSLGDVETLKVCIEQNRALFTKDRNMGLANQCVESLLRRCIQKMTLTFLTLSLEDIAKQVHISSADEAETIIVSMIEDGDITATVNQVDGTVSFLENSDKHDTSENMARMEADINRFIELQHKLEASQKSIELSSEYLTKTMDGGRDTLYPMEMEDDGFLMDF